jgi:hypothetical protein
VAAVALYLMRHPKGLRAEGADASASASASAAPTTSSAQTLIAAAMDGGVNTEEVTLEKVHIAKCIKAGPGATSPEQCDRQPFFEEALVKAILENTSCAPKTAKGGTLSFALKVDYKKRKTTLFAGKSGSIKRKPAADVIKCVTRSIPTPDWDAQKHDHAIYVVNVLATYPPSADAPP